MEDFGKFILYAITAIITLLGLGTALIALTQSVTGNVIIAIPPMLPNFCLGASLLSICMSILVSRW